MKVAAVPSSAVLPEMLVILKFSLPEKTGAAGAAGAGDSLSATLNVADVPPSAVLPETVVKVKVSLPDTDGASGGAGA